MKFLIIKLEINNTNVLIVLISILVIGLIILWNSYTLRCRACGKWYALRKVDSEIIDQKQVSIKKIVKDIHKNKKGDVIKTVEREVYVPAQKTKYLLTYECKYCNHRYASEETKVQEN